MEQCNATVAALTTVKEFETITVPPKEDPVRTLSIIDGLLTGLIILSVFIFVVIICGNLLTIIAVRTYRRLRSIISNLFILSLAVSDLLVGFSLPFHMCFYISKEVFSTKELCLIRFFLVIFSSSVSIMTLIAIALDRYIAILHGIHYKRFMTRRGVYYHIVLIWTLGFFIAIVPMFWNNWQRNRGCIFNEVLPIWYISFMIAPGFFIIWIVMLFIYCRISRVVAKQVRQCFHKSSEWKSLQIVIFVMGSFSLCWLPYWFIALFNMYRFLSSELIYLLAYMLAVLNSGLNPLIYAWKNSHFRKAFRELLCCYNAQCELDHSSGHSHGSAHQQRQGSIFSVSMHAFAMLGENECPNVVVETQVNEHKIEKTHQMHVQNERKILTCGPIETFLRKSKQALKDKFRHC